MSATLALGGLFDNGLGALIHWFPLTCILGTFPSKANFILCLWVTNDSNFEVMAAGAMLSMPESPVYLLKRGREEEAVRSLQWLRGAGYDVTEEVQKVHYKYNILRVFECSQTNTLMS